MASEELSEVSSLTAPADEVVESPKGSLGLLNCHFSLNHAALSTIVRPVVAEMVQDSRMQDRMSALEAQLARLQAALELKADSRRLPSLASELDELRLQLKSKAEQQLVLDMGVHTARLEESLSWKVEKAAFDTLAISVQQLSQLIHQKADLTALNRVQATVQRLVQSTTETTKLLQDTAAVVRELDGHHLPQAVQRTRELLAKTGGAVKTLQEQVAAKAEQQALDMVANAVHHLDAGIGVKANQQSILELRAILNDLRLQLMLKADQSGLDRSFGEIQHLSSQLSRKAEQQQVQEAAASVQALQQVISQKADLRALNEAKARVSAVEGALEQKADRRDVPCLAPLQLDIAERADRASLGELARSVERLQLDLTSKAEASACADVHAAVDQLRLALGRKADHDALSQHMADLERRLQVVAEQTRQRAEQALDESLGSCALGAMTGSPGGLGTGLGGAAFCTVTLGPESPQSSQGSTQASHGSLPRAAGTGRTPRSKSGQRGTAASRLAPTSLGDWPARRAPVS